MANTVRVIVSSFLSAKFQVCSLEVSSICLGPGDPFLAPDPSVIAESVVETIRYLHGAYPKWTTAINSILLERLESAKVSRRAGDEVSLVQLWPALLVIAGADPGLRVGAKCQNSKGETGLVLGVTNRAQGSIRVAWDRPIEMDNSETNLDQNSIAEVNATTVRPASYIAFDLDKFDAITSDTIRALARLVDLDSMSPKSTLTTPRGTPRNSTRTTPKPSITNADAPLRSLSPPPTALMGSLSVQSGNIEDKTDRHLARKFASQMIQNAGLRTIMMIFSTCNISDISENSAKKSLLAELISHSSKPSSLEVGVPLGDLIRTSNVMLSSAIGAASPWECPKTTGSFSDDSLASSDEEADDEPMSDDEDDEDYLTDAEQDDDSSMPPVLQALINQVNEATAALNQNGTAGISEIERVLGQAVSERANSRNSSNQQTQSSQQSRRISRSRDRGTRSNSSHPPSSNPPPSNPPPIGPAPPPPPPPPVTALVEMGFTLEHIQEGIRAQNFNASSLNATQIAMLASWLIENPAPPTPQQPAEEEEPEHESSMVDFEDMMNDNFDSPRPLFDSEDDHGVSQQASNESLNRTLEEFDNALAAQVRYL